MAELNDSMRKWILICGCVVMGCTTNRAKDSLTEKKPIGSAEFQRPIDSQKIRRAESAATFDIFLKQFNTDCDFQKSRVKFPLQVISLLDFRDNNYDQSALNQEEYECIQLTQPRSNIIEGQIVLRFDRKPNETIVTLGAEDTGVHIRYFFTLIDEKWTLIKLVDEST